MFGFLWTILTLFLWHVSDVIFMSSSRDVNIVQRRDVNDDKFEASERWKRTLWKNFWGETKTTKNDVCYFFTFGRQKRSPTQAHNMMESLPREFPLSLLFKRFLSLSLSLLSLFLPGFCSRIAFTKFNSSSPSLSLVSDSHVEVLSLSSGVGTSSQSGSAGSATTPTTEIQRSLILPGMHVVCLENHSSGEPGSLHITQGDIIEGKTELGLSYSPSKLGCFTL